MACGWYFTVRDASHTSAREGNEINLRHQVRVETSDMFSILASFMWILWRRKWQPTPVLLPWESHEQRNRPGYSPWGRKSRTQLWLNHDHHVGSLPLAPPGTPLYTHACTLIHRWTNKVMWINSVSNRCTGLPGSSVVKNLPVKQEMRVLSLGKEIPWRRKWQPNSVFLPGKSHRQRSLVAYSPRDCKRVGHGLGTKQQQQHNKCTHTTCCLFIQSCQTLCNHVHCSPWGSSFHWIL